MTTMTTERILPARRDESACAGPGCGQRNAGCKTVQLRTPISQNKVFSDPFPLCPACRKRLNGQWRYFRKP